MPLGKPQSSESLISSEEAEGICLEHSAEG